MAGKVCAVSIHSYSRFGVPQQSLVCCGEWSGVWYGVVCAAMCGVVCGAMCGVVCGVESTPIIVFCKSCVNTYEGCFEDQQC